MGNAFKVIFIILAVVIVLALFLSRPYNQLVTLDEEVNTAWSQVENQLQRRYDLIPNLVETVKGYAAHEKEVFIEVAKARASVGGARTPGEKIQANNQLTGALSRLLLVVERYPELKANENFIRLQDELAGTENRIAVERRKYNEKVKVYNQKVRHFPTNMIAGFFGFEKRPYFEAPTEAKQAPKVDFSGK
ncbi:MAG: LemA family protein [Calditrichaeota bacterium]|nr:LemA family protein [Calditrichota bacterium]